MSAEKSQLDRAIINHLLDVFRLDNLFEEVQKQLQQDGEKDRSRLIKVEDEVRANKQTTEDLHAKCKQLRIKNRKLQHAAKGKLRTVM